VSNDHKNATQILARRLPAPGEWHHLVRLVLAIIFHALSNLFSFWLLSFLAEPQTVILFVALMPWLAVIVLQKWLGKAQFPGKS